MPVSENYNILPIKRQCLAGDKLVTKEFGKMKTLWKIDGTLALKGLGLTCGEPTCVK